MLTERQQDIFDVFMKMIELKTNYFLPSEERCIGKTYVLNELAFTLQALGYRVYILTPYAHNEFFAERNISLDLNTYRGMMRDKTVVIVDEARYIMMDDLIDYCQSYKVPVIGYINFKPFDILEKRSFATEYISHWCR